MTSLSATTKLTPMTPTKPKKPMKNFLALIRHKKDGVYETAETQAYALRWAMDNVAKRLRQERSICEHWDYEIVSIEEVS